MELASKWSGSSFFIHPFSLHLHPLIMDLQQELMEFVYGLLDEDEANAICDRITSDPEVARAYAKVKLQCDLLARAARVDAPNVAWIRPEGIDSSDDDPQPVSSDWSKHSYR